jgi:predicted TIM-barrel fold metal-dependent hydrolase
MDAMGIDYQVVFPTTLLGLGMAPVALGEAQIGYAYNRWMIERFCAQDSRIKFLPFLPMRSPEMALRIVREFAGKPGVVGFLVTSVRYAPVHDNAYMQLYAEIEETGLPIAFHAGPTWDDDWMKTMNRFISVHALSFVHCNMVHMTNWVINGIPERFPRLKVIWIESGLAWVPFLMQRLDHEFLKRTSEAPLLTRLPSEYMRDMYFTSQPMECDNYDLLEATMKAINAETQLLYASDWPHWDFDLPSSILGIPFLDDTAKRNILGLNAARLFGIDVPARNPERAEVS